MSGVALGGRVLWLTSDAELVRRQLAGEDLSAAPDPLDDVSTDEMAPAWASYHYGDKLAGYCLTGLREGSIRQGDVKSGGFEVLVAGERFGSGSSRETAPFAQRAAGIRCIFARSFAKIYRQNAENLGILTSTDFELLQRLLAGQAVPVEAFTAELDELGAEVVRRGGLFGYGRARLAGELEPPAPAHAPRAQTLVEKIIAAHLGVSAVVPGDAVFACVDVRFSHDYVTAMIGALLRAGFGDDVGVHQPESVYLFRDHLTFAESVLGEHERRLGLVDQQRLLAAEQERFAKRHGLTLFGEVTRDGAPAGSEAICHNKVIEALALPGAIVIGTDSHACMAGVLGCLAFGVGSSDMAYALVTGEVRLRVPETVRVELVGTLDARCSAKDVMLALLAEPFIKGGGAAGKVLEFCGDGLLGLDLDERATLTNMSVEAGAFTGVIEPDQRLLGELAALRAGQSPRRGAAADISRERDELAARVVRGDHGARYAAELRLDLSRLEPMVATPGDPKNAVPLSALGERVRIDIAYGGSCTGGKRSDMDLYARALAGRSVAPGVTLYIQFGSQLIRRYAEERGHVDVFEKAGATLLDPACGACIRAGPGASTRAEQVTVSAINRNFPGRSGPGRVYLASPLTVAASAVAGYITAFECPARSPLRSHAGD